MATPRKHVGNSLRREKPGKGPSPVEVVEARIEVVMGDYLALVPDGRIKRTRALEWKLTRRQVHKYLTVVKARCKRQRAEAEDARAAQYEALLLGNLARQLDTERRAKAGEDFKAEVASQRAQVVALERLAAMNGADAPVKVDATVTRKPGIAAKAPGERARRLAELMAKMDAAKARLPQPPKGGEDG